MGNPREDPQGVVTTSSKRDARPFVLVAVARIAPASDGN
jgi:hypothetical protein